MTISKAITTAGVGAAIVVGSMLAVNAASAHSGEKQSELVDRLATELNVDAEQVQGVFDQLKEERQAEREAERTEHLAGLVEDGTLTQDQADALSAKWDELKAEREALKDQDLSKDEIKEQMEASREEFKSWAEEQGIDLDAIRPEKGEGFRKGGPRGRF